MIKLLAIRRKKYYSQSALIIVKAFGTGVILSTGFIHMFAEANEKLTDPCVLRVLNHSYAALGAAIALFSILVLQLIQTVSTIAFRSKPGGGITEEVDDVSDIRGQTAACGHGIHRILSSKDESLQNEKKLITYLLEISVGIHSVIIGLSLGFSSGPEWASLLIAIAFHQLLEGFTLSSLGTL
jgi:zinc transporter 1/2/3